MPASAGALRATPLHPAVRLIRGETLPELGGRLMELRIREHYEVLEVMAVVQVPGVKAPKRVAWQLDGASVMAAL